MKTFTFDRKKYGLNLLIDLSKFEDIPHYFFKEEPHTVDFYEIFFFRKAKGVLQLDAKRIKLTDNLIVYASPYQRRRWYVNRDEIDGYFLIFANGFFKLIFADKLFAFKLKFFHNYQAPLILHESEEIRKLNDYAFEKIFQELSNLKEDSETLIQAFLMLILVEHNRKYCVIYGIHSERNDNLISYQFKQLLESEIHKNPKVEDFAQLLGISRVTLNKQAKDKFGVTASQLIKERLLVEIERELLFSTKTVSEISYSLHFSEPHHLIRFFKKRKNQTPIEFRLSYQNGYV